MEKRFAHLLAKKPVNSWEVRREETLVGHTQLVCDMAETISGILSASFRNAFEVDDCDYVFWTEAVLLGAWMHDWGKANSDFQKLVRNPGFMQGIRHETVSLLLLIELEEWLAPYLNTIPPWVSHAALFSASGHHLKFPDPSWSERPGREVTLLTGHKDFSKVLELKRTTFSLGKIPELQNIKLSLFRRREIDKRLTDLKRKFDHDFGDKEKLLIAAAKSVVMAADLAGSALPAKTEDPYKWLSDRLIRSLTQTGLQKIVCQRIRGKRFHKFQQEVANSDCLTTLVEAGCGSGKTVAAFAWAAGHADGKRLFFCYPTTGTASEGFGGYLMEPEFDAVLIHSRARVDYELLENLPDPSHEESELRDARLEAMETWPIPAVVCTAHTVLGLFENVRRGLYALPCMIQSVFVFDEVHAFSDRLFSYLLRFLETFTGAPVLLMSATLPNARKAALEKVARSRGGLQVVKGPAKRESAKRYELELVTDEEAWSRVQACLSKNGKVLWVCNTVGKAMKNLDLAMGSCLPVEPYHSRYRYMDRLSRHRRVIDGFFKSGEALLAVTTQVAEMSLDLSADLLVTEYAPVPSLIQRLGRLNRYEETPEKVCKALLLDPESTAPYSPESMDGLHAWLARVADGKPKSQSDLAEAFCAIDSDLCTSPEPVSYCEWLDGLWSTRPEPKAIDEAGYTFQVIREEDLGKGDNMRFVIPMPIPKVNAWKTWDRHGHYVVAPKGTINYDPFRGAQWQKTN